jgi:signal transduction histidine kinase
MSNRSAFVRLLDWFIPPEHLAAPESTRASRLAVGTYLIVSVFNVYYAGLSLLIGFPGGVWGQVLLLCVGIACLFLYRWRTPPWGVAGLFFATAIVSISMTTYASGGFESPVLQWLATSPIVALLVAGRRAGLLTLLAALASTGIFFLMYQAGMAAPNQVPEQYQRALEISSYGGLILIVFVIAAVFQRFKVEAFRRLNDKNDELQHTLESLRRTQRQLVHAEKMASLGSLTAGIAHEIKNPLNFVNNFAGLSRELVAELVQESDADRRAEILDQLQHNAGRIEEHGQRADRIVRAMMEHARRGTGEHTLVPFNDLVQEYAAHAHAALVRPDPDAINLRVDLDERVSDVECVATDVGRVLVNLLDNAFDAALDSRGPDRGAPTVTVSTRHGAGYVELRVADNGPGMPETVRERAFEPFYTTKPTGEGTGLGLSMSYEIVAHGHGGSLEVERSDASGTIVVVRLPAQASTHAAPVVDHTWTASVARD